MALPKLPSGVLFVLTGGIAAVCNVTSRRLLSHFISFELAIVLAYMIGMLVAYALMRRFVFGPSGDSVPRELGRFAVVNLLGVAQTFGVSLLLARLLDGVMTRVWAEGCAHVVGVAVPAFTSFVGHRAFSFRRRRSQSAAALRKDLVPGASPDL